MNMKKRILVITAVTAEREAVLRGLSNNTGFDVLESGVGLAAAAASTAKVLATASAGYSLVISAGIGGGFPGKAEAGTLVVANEIVAADLGVETSEGFRSLDELGFGPTCLQVDTGLLNRVTRALLEAELPVTIGPVLTVSTVTGTAAGAAEMAARVPGAAAEAMEGYGVAIAAYQSGVPVMEIRAVSNQVGPRDRTAWRIKEALASLETASSILQEVLP